jgi:hypothetical protein
MSRRRRRDFALGLSAVLALVGLLYVGAVTGLAEASPSIWPALFWLQLIGTFLLLLLAIINVLPRQPKWDSPFLTIIYSLLWVTTFSGHFSNSGWNFLTISSALAILCHLIVAGWLGAQLTRTHSNRKER